MENIWKILYFINIFRILWEEVMSSFRVRTDLALEVRENMEENARECRGVSVKEEYREESELRITKVVIETMNAGFQQLNKEKISTGRIKPAFFCQILVVYMLYMLYLYGTIGMR